MPTEQATTLITMFGGHRRVGLLHVRSSQSSMTLRRPSVSPAPPDVVAGPAPIKVAATTVGTIHLRPSNGPEAVAGLSVGKGQEIGWIQTSGRRTAILATAPGTIDSIEVTDGEFVEFGQTLLRLLPDADTEGRG
jgi:biotin carboxyl carrier protein